MKHQRTPCLLVFAFSCGLLLFAGSPAHAQVYNGDLTLQTQADVDAFSYTSVTGHLTIYSYGITNIDSLVKLQSVGVELEITNTSITNIDGLSNLTSIGMDLLVRGNPSLTNLNGFSNLTTIGRAIYFLGNGLLADYDGLLSLTSTVEGIRIASCPVVNLHGFSNVHEATGFLEFEDDPDLTDLGGLEGFQESGVVNSIKINNNPKLQNIDGLSSVTMAGDLWIMGNSILTNIDGLSNLVSLVSTQISGNPDLTNIDGLSNIQTTTGSIFIRENSALQNLDGLGSLTSVGKELILSYCPNVDGLSKLTSIGTNLIFSYNPQMVNLDGLANLVNVGNDVDITMNIKLVDFCGLYNLFHAGTIGGTVNIYQNGANTVTVTPTDITVNADAGVCSALIPDAVFVDPVQGCLVPVTSSHSDFPAGNIFPVGTTDITWQGTDAAHDTAVAVQHVTVVDNQPPTITCPANITVSCASEVPAPDVDSVTASDNCSAIVTYVGDDTTNKTCVNRFLITRTYKATDPAGNFTTCSQQITVYDNTPPTLTGLAPSQSVLWPPNHKMRDITLSYTATDNCVTNLSTSVSITSSEPVNGTGDGDTDPDWQIVDDHHVRLRGERAAHGNGRVYTITVTVSDGCNPPVSDSTQVIVAHNITGPLSGSAFKVGTTVGFSGEFWDTPTNTHTSSWLIDGKTSVKGSVAEPTATKNGSAEGSYRFGNAGVYKLQMNITDQTGTTSYANSNGDLEAIVVIYDPNSGYTVGGGWFTSPAGSFAEDRSLTGKVSFGFAMSYFKSATNPKGETQFQFSNGGLEFDAVNFSYLSISGPKAQFKGAGKITGDAASYNFLLTVIDGDATNGGGTDKIRMKIYNKNTGAVVYDSQTGASDAAVPTTPVGDGSSIAIVSGGTAGETITFGRQTEDQPTRFSLEQNYPNPFNPATTFTFAVPQQAMVALIVYDVLGREVATLVHEEKSPGVYSVEWNAGAIASGLYYYRMTAGDFVQTRKLLLMK